MSAIVFLELLLPKLSFDAPPEISFTEMLTYFQLNLSEKKRTQVSALHSIFDVYNLRCFLINQTMPFQGVYPRHTLQEKTILNEPIIKGTESFFALYPTLGEKQKHVDILYKMFLESYAFEKPSFVQKYFRFEYFFRQISAYLRAENLKISYEIDPEALPFDLQTLSTWPEEFLPLVDIFHKNHSSPIALEHELSKWKFSYFESLLEEQKPFSFEKILLYFLERQLLEMRKNMHNPQFSSSLKQIIEAVA